MLFPCLKRIGEGLVDLDIKKERHRMALYYFYRFSERFSLCLEPNFIYQEWLLPHPLAGSYGE
jgi:hypothetical protein